ncbi:hypothetical protein [Bradyrhizobium sp. HKCCYLR20261]|uniref:hypothetical protein n=1 Tax=Bradyrhizobium sp. HKCCYLR20261 TaxID=3420760 RepID=UPI003EB86EBC
MFYQTSEERAQTARVVAGFLHSGAKAALGALALMMSIDAPLAEEIDFGPYRVAAEYCAGDVARPLSLSPDRRTLCFEGRLDADQDLSLVNELQAGGLFVVRSQGGDDVAMMKLADRLRARDAIVVVRSYCLAGCASYFVFASGMTIILKQGLVAWQPLVVDGLCVGFLNARDKNLPRLDIGYCSTEGHKFFWAPAPIYEMKQKFMSTRRASRDFEEPPESTFVRRALSRLGWPRERELAPVMWTWHPRFHKSSVKTKIVYEHYPESQEEVGALVERWQLGAWVIYDP